MTLARGPKLRSWSWRLDAGFFFSFLILPGALLLALCGAARAVGPTDPLDATYFPTGSTPISFNTQSNVWITGPLEKVRQDDGTLFQGTTNWAFVYSAQNEFQSFQVHYHAPATRNLNVSMSNLTLAQGTSNYVIYSTGTDIVIYKEAYMNVLLKSAVGNTYYNTIGKYPDALIPKVDPYFHQTTNAFPISVTGGNNQSVWIDVHVPTAAPSGYYSGIVTADDGVVVTTLPVVYAVWAWMMPSTATLHNSTGLGNNAMCVQQYGPLGTNTGGYSGCAAYPGVTSGLADEGVVRSQIDAAVMMLDHRMTLTDNVYPPAPNAGSFTTGPGGIAATSFESNYAAILNGTGGNSNTAPILSGAKVTAIGPFTIGSQPTQANISAWGTEFANKGWNASATLFDYSCDEPPSGCSFATITAHETNLRAASPTMPSLVTETLDSANKNGVQDQIDIMVPNIAVKWELNADNSQNTGRTIQVDGANLRNGYDVWMATHTNPSLTQIWSYESCSSAATCTQTGSPGGATGTWPNYHIDGKSIANRAMEWFTYLHRQTGELYFDATYCWTSGASGRDVACGLDPSAPGAPGGSAFTQDPWTSLFYSGANGDGTLIYPGRTAGSNNVGTAKPIWLPSIRLKQRRDGMQDYEYMYALNQYGQGTLVQNQAVSWITNSYTFNNNPNSFTDANARVYTGTLLTARGALGTALHQLTFPPGNAIPPVGIALSGVSTNTITISWTADGPGVSYNVLTSTATNPFIPAGAIQTSSNTFNTFLSTAGLNPNTTYYFRVDASSLGFVSGFTTAVGTSTLSAPPLSVTFASVSSSTFTSQWTSNDGPNTKYRVVLATNSAFGPALSTTTLNGTSINYSSLNPSTSYFVEVQAIGNGADVSAFTAPVSTITLLGPPGAGAAPVPGNAALTYSWTNGGNAIGTLQYLIQISTNANLSPLWTGGSSTTFNTSAVFGTGGQGTALAPNTTYFAQVQIVNNGSGLFSPFITLAPASTLAAAPNQPTIVASSSFSLTAQWTSPDGPVTTFQAVLSANPNFSPALSTVTVAGSLQSNGTSNGTASFNGLSSLTTYYLEAIALGNNGDTSAPSTSVSTITLLAPPGLASPVFVAMSTNATTVAWTNGGNAGTLQYQTVLSTNSNFNTIWASSLTYNTSAAFGALGQGSALNPNTTYYSQVLVYNNGFGNYSGFTSLGSSPTWANPPTGSTVVAVSSVTASLTWNFNNNPTITQYQVFRDTSPAFSQPVITVVTSTPAVIGNLSGSTTYYFKVRAINWAAVVSTTDVIVTTMTNLGNAVLNVGNGGGVVNYPATGQPTIKLMIPGGSFPSSVQVTLGNTPVVTPPANVGSNVQNVTGSGSYVEVTLVPPTQPNILLTIQVNYDPVVVAAAGLDQSTLFLARYDPAANVWVPLVTTVDATNHLLTAQTGHLSTFQIMGGVASTSVSSVVVFPNPLRPSLGPNYSVMSFGGLPSGTRLRIYTVTGHLVRDLSANAAGMAQWDGTNQSGASVASGVYFVFAEGNGTKSTIKVAVQR